MTGAVLQLHIPGLVQPDYLPEQTLDERFAAFHQANPEVFEVLKDIALDMLRHGATRVGIGLCFEVARWSALRTRGDEAWKLNNSFRSRYSRLLSDTVPELAGVFEMRELRS